MTDVLWLAIAWLVRVAAWLVMAYGAILAGMSTYALATRLDAPVHPAVLLAVGLGFFAIGTYAESRARSKIRRLTARPDPQGFEVIGLATAKDKGDE